MKKNSILSLVLFAFVLSSCEPVTKDVVVNSWEAAVYFDESNQELQVLGYGVYKMPVNAKVTRYPLRKLDINQDYELLTKDKKNIRLSVLMWFQINKEHIQGLHRLFGSDFKEKLIIPSLSNTLRNLVRETNFEEIQTDSITAQVINRLNTREDFHKYIDINYLSVD